MTNLQTRAQTSDKALMAAWQEGDLQAAKELYRRYCGTVCQFFRNKISDLQEVGELVSETFLELVKTRSRQPDSGQVPDSFRAYLLGIARNVLFQYLRRQYRRKNEDLELCSIEELAPHSLSSIVASRRELAALVRGLRALPLADQILFEAKYFDYLTDVELAHLLRIPASTIPGRLRAARRRLLSAVESGRANLPETASVPPAAALEQWITELRAEIARTNPSIAL